MKWTAAAVGVVALAGSALGLVPVDDVVRHALDQERSVDIFVQFKSRTPASAEVMAKLSREERLRKVYTELRELASETQADLLASVKSRGFHARTMWINNSLYVKAATPALVKELRKLKNAVEIYADSEVARIDEPMVEQHVTEVKGGLRAQWNIEIINAPAAWGNYTDGAGVTLANIDTGVRFTHEALIANYRGNLGGGSYSHDFNWYDPNEVQLQPYDNNGHGTHTMGTSAGSVASGVGVAPGSKWIAAKGCASSSCSNVDLMGSFQYLLAPTRQGDYDGEGDVTQAPTVINNSWGGGRGSSTYLSYIQPHVEAGNVVVFSQGNSGSACSTANSPGDLYIVIGVGSTDSSDRLSSFSSRGPGIGTENFPLQKPDISAPGGSVYSSYPTTDTSYATLSGTSMASPHITGVVALLRAAYPSITIDQISQVLTSTAVQGLGQPTGGQTTCAGVAYTTYPNYHYGYGRVDATAALDAARALFQ